MQLAFTHYANMNNFLRLEKMIDKYFDEKKFTTVTEANNFYIFNIEQYNLKTHYRYEEIK